MNNAEKTPGQIFGEFIWKLIVVLLIVIAVGLSLAAILLIMLLIFFVKFPVPSLLAALGVGLVAVIFWVVDYVFYQAASIHLFPNLIGGLDLGSRDLRSINIRLWNLRRAKLSGSNLSAQNLSNKVLARSDLSYATLSDANLASSDLRSANLSYTDFSGANLSGADLRGANLCGTNFHKAILANANFTDHDFCADAVTECDFSGARLVGCNFSSLDLPGISFRGSILDFANLSRANMPNACLDGASLRCAKLNSAILSKANLTRANLSGADLTSAQLNEANIEGANLEGCKVFGIAAWGIKGKDANQSNLTITKPDETTITVDGLKVAHFVYLMLEGDQIREVLDTLTGKSVLILGRFSKERLVVLKALQEALRRKNYIPILFDFEKPANRNILETVSTIAHMSRFIVADITEPRAIPGELTHIIPNLLVPVIPIFQPAISSDGGNSTSEWSMFWDLREYDHVLSTFDYKDIDMLLHSIETRIISPAEGKLEEILKRRAELKGEKMRRRENRDNL